MLAQMQKYFRLYEKFKVIVVLHNFMKDIRITFYKNQFLYSK
jgi:hypothetical protein